MVLTCKVHGKVKHYVRKDKGGGHRCSECSKEAVNKRRRKLKLLAVKYLGGSCVVCGYDRCVASLDIHHTRDKEFGIAHKGVTRSWERLKAELDKCILLCKNCHGEYHAGVIDIPD